MTALAASASGALAVVRRDFRIAVSYRFRFISGVLAAFFSLTLFYYVSRLVRVERFESPDEYYGFVVAGLIILQVLQSTLVTPSTNVRTELVAGTFERLAVSPFGAARALAASVLFPFVYSLVMAVVMLAFAATVFGLPVEWSTAPLALPAFALGAIAFVPFGLLLVAAVVVWKQAAGVAWLMAGITLLAGFYFPVELLPDWIEWTSNVQPFTPAVDLLRHLLIGIPLEDPAWSDVLRLVGFAAVLLPLSALAVKVALRTGRRRGTMLEY
jgi:ABC-2 type transport system permease protein